MKNLLTLKEHNLHITLQNEWFKSLWEHSEMSYKSFLDSITNQVLTMKPISSDIPNVQLSVSLLGLFMLQKWLDLPPCPRPII
jgi:hypothetical protein